ncbi:tyrosine-type recombinase/integrase [Roseinatronobacter alkalisoli]|uniref:Site-specific integrase n=1 Tax=Roseinatronobacter alkalisoli TaxID=3028235 RepID=A0ABT5TE22_9RHOB|nr:site-specific integrase [Roseinatronobacter sp. HJB301]MDD7973204.1 site-specific integrase [Roseinatronobacter sp. HJB301]
MPIAKLTRRGMTAIKPADKRVVYYDSALTGFALRVEPTGRMTYFIEYRPGAGGRSVAKKRLNLGTTEEFNPEKARERAKELLARVRLGADPAADRRADREMPLFRDFASRYLEEEAETKLKPASVRNYRSYIKKHILPALGTAKLDAIGASEVARVHRKVGKTSPVTANRLIECIGSIFRYAATCGLVEKGHNPAAGITAFKEHARERFLSAAELARLGETLALAETEGLPWRVSDNKHTPKENQRTIIDRHAVAAIRLLILTGLRLREVLHLRWSEIDFERGVALLADTKTGRRYAVLNAPALALLEDLERLSDWVIPGGDRDRPRSDLKRPWDAVRAHAGLDDVRLHDLRHTNASVAAGGGVPLAVIGKLLGHSQPSTTQRYAHLADDPVRAAADTVGNRIDAALRGRSAEIKPMRRGAGNA